MHTNYKQSRSIKFHKIGIVFFLMILVGCEKEEENTNYKIKIPDGMVYIQGGITTIGSNDGLPNEQPVFEISVNPFLMDKNLVTVSEYRKFVLDTQYISESELFNNGVVFDFDKGEWFLKEGVTWEYPNGKDSKIAEDDHPVRMVSWNDATEYLKWIGKRLPTEIEWEHAAKGAENINRIYSWGDSLVVEGKFKANTWNGKFPVANTVDDGYLQTSPVGAFNITELGLTDMGGNVWEWTQSWYRSYADRNIPFQPASNSEKVLRGGSFMCHVSYCHGYRTTARSHTPPENSLFHVGFRGVMDI
jgi:sulfatase modifying factor 1